MPPDWLFTTPSAPPLLVTVPPEIVVVPVIVPPVTPKVPAVLLRDASAPAAIEPVPAFETAPAVPEVFV